MNQRTHSARPAAAGFVLIGVVIFVLALTIIGLSLFSLSSYEAQFLQRSLDGEQAFQSAVGGIDRARFALSVPPYALQSVAPQDPPLEHVVAAVAIQNGDSTGTVDWQGPEVTIRVTTEVNGVRRMMEGRFSPGLTQNLYSHVITTSRELVVEGSAPAGPHPPDRRWTVDLLGSVSEGVAPPDTSWKYLLRTPPSRILTNAVATPDLATWFASHPVSLATPVPYDPVLQRYDLNAPQNAVEYFCAPSGHPPNEWYYNSWTGSEITVDVHGLAVWEFPRGLRFDERMHVTGPGGGNNCLVIVAGQVGDPPPSPETDAEVGIRLFAGLKVDPGISLILVSDGRVYLQHMNNPSGDHSYASDLTVYARSVLLSGPVRDPLPGYPHRFMTLQHASTGDLDNEYVDLLAGLGALPGASAAGGRDLTFVAGSWQVANR